MRRKGKGSSAKRSLPFIDRFCYLIIVYNYRKTGRKPAGEVS